MENPNTVRPETAEVETIANTHSHEREGDGIVQALVERASEGGADVLGPQPNTNEGLTTAEQVADYIGTAEELVRGKVSMHFIPFVMLTEKTTKADIAKCVEAEIVDGKMYPFMRTTKSDKGVNRWGKMLPVVRWCGELGMNVHGHFEHPNVSYSNRDAEYACLPVAEIFLQETEAKIFWEHGTDGRCIPHWKEMAKSGRFFVTITAHHLATNEDQAYGDVRSVCKPTIKTELDRTNLVRLVKEDRPWVMAGADDAPHNKHAKLVCEERCACGAYTAPFLLPLYAHALDGLLMTADGVETFINFTSKNARAIHNLPPASRRIKLVRSPFQIPRSYRIGAWTVQSFWAGRMLNWSFAE